MRAIAKARLLAFVCVIEVVAPSTPTPAFAAPSASATGPAGQAIEKKAAKLFAEGQTAFEAGDYRRAARLFERAYATKPHHSALWNAAKSWQRAGEDLTAVNLLLQYLKEAPPDASNRPEANAALAQIEKRVGRLQVQVVTVSSPKLDGNDVKEGVSYVAPGEHVFSAEDNGSAIRKVVTVQAGEIVAVTLAPPPPPPKPQVIVVQKERPKPLSPWFVVGGGVLTAGAGAATIIFGLMTVKNRDAFVGNKTQANLDAGYDAQLKTNIALGATIGLGVITTAVAIFLTNWSGSKEARP